MNNRDDIKREFARSRAAKDPTPAQPAPNIAAPVRGILGGHTYTDEVPDKSNGIGLVDETGPVRSLQIFLRNIASHYDFVPQIIPDGIFGEQTRDSLKSFQGGFGLEPTGETDFDTWNKIIEVSSYVDDINANASLVLVYPETGEKIYPGQHSIDLLVIQAMMKALSDTDNNFVPLEITSVHDENSVKAVRRIQQISGITEDGVITIDFFNNLTVLYEAYISRERVNSAQNGT